MLFLYLTLLLPPNCLPPSPPPPPSLPLPSLPSFLSHTAIRNTLTCPCRESDINDKRGRSFINVINVTNGHEKQLDRDVSDVTMPERHPLLLRAPQKKSYIHIHTHIYIYVYAPSAQRRGYATRRCTYRPVTCSLSLNSLVHCN